MIEIVLTATPQRIAFVTPDGDRIDAVVKLGPAGQAELEVTPGDGRSAVWVATDLIAGGEEDDGYFR